MGKNITKIGNYAFCSCKSLKSVSFNLELESIGEYAFEFCSMLDSILLPDSISYMGDFCFSFCDSLTAINIPSKVKIIHENAIANCGNLTDITFDYSEETLEIRANRKSTYWYDIWSHIENLNVLRNTKIVYVSNETYTPYLLGENLKSINIGRHVSSIENFFQREIKTLEKINIYNNEPPCLDEVGFGTNSFINAIVSIPEESQEIYNNNDFWCKFWNLQESKEVSTASTDIIIDDIYQMEVLDSLKIEIEIQPKDSTYPLHTKIENEEIAEINQDGIIFAKKTGSTNLIVTSGDVEKNIPIYVEKRSQNIIWDQTFDKIIDSDSIILNAKASSGLQINYNVIKGQELCHITDSILYVFDSGQIEIEASQSGDDYYKEATSVIKEFEVYSGVSDLNNDRSVGIKFEGNLLIIINRPENAEVEIFTSDGKLIYYGKSEYIPVMTKGILFVKIDNRYYKMIHK